MSSGPRQMGSDMTTVGQSFSSQRILQPSAEDSWATENTGITLSKPSSV
jgi:hypothetical protein